MSISAMHSFYSLLFMILCWFVCACVCILLLPYVFKRNQQCFTGGMNCSSLLRVWPTHCVLRLVTGRHSGGAPANYVVRIAWQICKINLHNPAGVCADDFHEWAYFLPIPYNETQMCFCHFPWLVWFYLFLQFLSKGGVFVVFYI